MKSMSIIKFFMFMKSSCPIFQWGIGKDLSEFEQISVNIGGFFGAFGALIRLLQRSGLLNENARLDNIKIGESLIFYRDNGTFQSIYMVESMELNNKNAIFKLIEKIDNKFLQMFGNQLKNWDHSIELFKNFKDVCEEFL